MKEREFPDLLSRGGAEAYSLLDNGTCEPDHDRRQSSLACCQHQPPGPPAVPQPPAGQTKDPYPPDARWNVAWRSASLMLRMALLIYGFTCLAVLGLGLTSMANSANQVAATLLLTASIIYSIIVPSSLVFGVVGGLTAVGLLRTGKWPTRMAGDHFLPERSSCS